MLFEFKPSHKLKKIEGEVVHIYNIHMKLVLVSLNGISTIVGYLMPNPFLYIYVKNMIFKHILEINQSFVYTQLNVKTVLYQNIQFSMSTTFKCQTFLFDP